MAVLVACAGVVVVMVNVIVAVIEAGGGGGEMRRGTAPGCHVAPLVLGVRSEEPVYKIHVIRIYLFI